MKNIMIALFVTLVIVGAIAGVRELRTLSEKAKHELRLPPCQDYGDAPKTPCHGAG